MDIDLFISHNAATWRRLDELTKRARTRVGRLTPQEIDELVGYYQMTSSHLSHARAAYRDPGLTMQLSALVAQAGGVIHRGKRRPGSAVRDFFVWRFPGAVYQSGRFILVSALLLLVPALLAGFWLARDDRALDTAMPEETREAYLEEDFENYYSEDSAVNFGSAVLINNIQVSFIAFAGGVLLLPTAFVMVNNGYFLGQAAAVFVSVGQFDKFMGLVAPHGLLELTAVVIAGAAGLRMGWSIVAPPADQSRIDALGAEARRAGVVVLGLMLAFTVAAFIEGFITGRGVDTWLRVTIGVAAQLAFVAWIVFQGREASRRGVSGELGELELGWDELAAARERAWAA